MYKIKKIVSLNKVTALLDRNLKKKILLILKVTAVSVVSVPAEAPGGDHH